MLIIDCAGVTERLDATLDNYELEGRKPEQSCRTSQELVSSPPFVLQSVTADGLVNGRGAHNGKFITHVDLHHPPQDRDDGVTPVSMLDEPEPDYDSKDEENGDVRVDGFMPPPTTTTEVVDCGPPPVAQPPTPPPLPPLSSLGFSAGREISLATKVQSTGRSEPAEVVAARKRDEAHAALIAAVQRRRHLLDSVDGEVIVDNIENRVQRSKVLQTVYRADNGAAPFQLCRSDESAVEHQPVGLLAVADPPPPATTTTSNGDFISEAERVRIEYVRRLQPAKQPPPTKPVRSQPPTASKSSENGDGQVAVIRTAGTAEPPPPVPRRSAVVNESHNRALVAYVNSSSKVYTAAAAPTTTRDVDNTTQSFVRLHDVGESTTEPSLSSSATADSSSHDRRLRVMTDDTASVLSSLSTLSTNSSVGVGGVCAGDGAASPHGSPSHSSSGDSGFAKSSTNGGGAVTTDQPIIPPPSEFASPSDNSSSSSSASVQTTIPGAALRSVARNQSHSMVFPARTQLTQK